MAFPTPENHCQFIGRIGKEPRPLNNGDRLVFSIAVKNPNPKEKDNPFWVSIFVGGPTVEYINKYVTVGDMLVVMCQYRTWKDKNGNDAHGFDAVSVNKFGGGSQSNGGDRNQRDSTDRSGDRTERTEKAARAARADINDNDIPF